MWYAVKLQYVLCLRYAMPGSMSYALPTPRPVLTSSVWCQEGEEELAVMPEVEGADQLSAGQVRST